MSTPDPSLAELQARVAAFVAARDWRRFHTPKNLALSMAIEVGELLEQFQWLDADQIAARLEDDGARAAIADELADVLIYALSLAEATGIDPATAILTKLSRNEERFPVDQVRGRLGTRPGGGHARADPSSE